MFQIIRSPLQLGTAISNARKERGWTQRDLSALSGLRQELISRIETGHEGTKLSSIQSLFAVLDLDLIVEERNARNTQGIEDIF
ncbi:helix-turn-helix domain-containing protein [Sphingomonas sp. IW22]|uniref:helix-turn-helix domain-containing protein n=1 Tax=Sphingomonas sp. IW22 TaxID=3242489 RepID=UPI00351FB40A